MKRKDYLNSIITLLAQLKAEVELSNRISFHDINIVAEDFFRDFLNLIYDYNLVNINIIEKENFPAIDLGDKSKSTAIQVTSDSTSTKIKYTIKQFIEKGLFKDYRTLIIILLKKKRKYSAKFDTQDLFVFKKNDHIKDIDDLIRDIRNLKTEHIRQIHNFLERELGGKGVGNIETIANEVETIMSLIEYLSDEKNLDIQELSSNPDPEEKIFKRFSDYTDFLKREIQEYIPMYENKRKEAESVMGLDSIKSKSIRMYLQVKSDSVLRECNCNPKTALDRLTILFEQNLSKAGKSYNHGAIRYYLIDQIIQCNVFPNVEVKR